MVTFNSAIFVTLLVVIVAVFTGMASAGLPFVPPESPTSMIPPWFAFNIGCKLHNLFKSLAFATQPPDAYIIDLATSYWNSEVAYALTKNGILNALENETSAACETVAEKLGLQSFVVCRYMEAGKNLHLLSKDASTKEYSLTPHGSLLTKSGGMEDWMTYVNEDTTKAWRAMGTEGIKTGGKSGFEIVFNQPVWEYFDERPAVESQFGRAMKALNPGPTGAFLLDWTPPSADAKFCDIGGGIGSLLGDVLMHYPKMTGIVFDLPTVAERGKDYLAELGLEHRAKAIGGNFLSEDLPEELAECDVFFLRYVIHDWDDDSNIVLLKNIKDVAEKDTSESKKMVVVMDQIIETGAPAFLEKAKSLMTLNMLSSCSYGARERSLDEHVDLFEAAGYENVALGRGSATKLIPMRTIQSLVQVDI